MKKALAAAAVAVAAVVGLIVAVAVSPESQKRGSAAHSTSSRTASESTTAHEGTTHQGTTSTAGSGSTSGTTSGQGTTRTATTSPVPTTTVKLAPPPNPKSPRRRTFVVGTVDDALAQSTRGAALTQAQRSRGAGFNAAVVSATWKRGSTSPSSEQLRALRNVVAATRRLHMRMYVVAWHGLAANTPRNADERAQFALFAGALAKALPNLSGLIVGNEPNLNTFWVPQFGSDGRDLAANAYENLLARTYDAVKHVSPHLTVIGAAISPRGADRPNGIRPTHSPTAFIRDLGAAYRRTGRRKPLMDAFAIHPYMQAARVPPTVKHSKTTSITIADYGKLVALLQEAFHGTHQRGATLPIIYAEFGVQTVVPGSKRSVYEAGTTEDAADAVSFKTQVDYYRQALSLAFCQPTVRGLFIFHTFDEISLDGWQSGLYFADSSPKPSLPGFRRAVADLRAGTLTSCR